MASDHELRLVTKIIYTGDLRTVLRNNISQSMFSTPEAREIFKHIKEHYHNPAHYGETPTKRQIIERFPATKLLSHPSESLEALCEEVRKKTMARELREACAEAADLIDIKSPYEALAHLRAKINTVQTMTSTSRDLILADGADDLISEYTNQETMGTMLGIPWPWNKLNEETGGIQQQDFIILFGRPKHMKSWIATKILTHAYAFGSRRVLVYSCEMPPAQFRKRVAACVAEIDYEKLKKNKLSEDEKEVYFQTLRNLKKEEQQATIDGHSPSIMFTSDKDDLLGGGVSHILSKAEAFKPDLIVVDSFYRMKNDRSGKRSMKWQDQYAIIQDLKHLTQQLDVPVIGVTQRSRKKGDDDEGGNKEEEHLEDIAYADAAGQEADMIMRIKKGATVAGVGKEPPKVCIDIMIAGAREIRPGGMLVYVSPCTTWDFGFWLSDTGKMVKEGAEQATHEGRTEEQINASYSGKREAKVTRKGKKSAPDRDGHGVPLKNDMVYDPQYEEAMDDDYVFGGRKRKNG